MSVTKKQSTRELSHHKRNVVLELFGTSKKHIINKENVPENVRPMKRYLQVRSNNPGNILNLMKRSQQELPRTSSNYRNKNEESSILERTSRKKHLTLLLDEPINHYKQVISPHRDFRSQFSFDPIPQYTQSRKVSIMSITPAQPASSVKRSNSFRDLFKSSIKFG